MATRAAVPPADGPARRRRWPRAATAAPVGPVRRASPDGRSTAGGRLPLPRPHRHTVRVDRMHGSIVGPRPRPHPGSSVTDVLSFHPRYPVPGRARLHSRMIEAPGHEQPLAVLELRGTRFTLLGTA